MQALTHFQTGILIQILCFMFLIFPFNIIFTIIFAFLSHFIVDAFAKITFHPPEPLQEDYKFWKAWGIIIIVATIAFVIWFIAIGLFWFYFWGGFFSVLVDIVDWGILRPIQYRRNKSETKSIWTEGYFFHKMIDKFREKTLFWLPNWNYKRKGVIPEIIIIIFYLLLIILLI